MSEHRVRSADGSTIGWRQTGEGPVLVMVHGATADRNRFEAVERALAEHYTLVLMDRRGRGLSTDEAVPYGFAREVDDVRAVVAAAAAAQGSPVLLFGHSFGGICVLDAALGNPDVARLMAYEPAFATPGHTVIGPEALAALTALIEAGRGEDALVSFFVDVIGVPPAMMPMLKSLPSWQQRLAAVPTLPREGEAANHWQPTRLAELTMPLRILVGQISPPWLRAAAVAAHAAAPGASLVELPGHAHAAMDTGPKIFVEALRAFF